MVDWILMGLMSALFAALTTILAKIGVSKVDSDLATAIRTTVVLIMAWFVVLVVGSFDQLRSISARSLVFLVLSGLATGGSWLCYFKALKMGDANKVAPVDKSSVIIVMIMGFVFLGETFSVLSVIGLVMIFIGTMLMIERKDVVPGGGQSRSWVVYAVLSAVFAALTSILGKVGIEGVESNLGTAVRTVVVLFMAWFVVVLRRPVRKESVLDRRSCTFLVLSGVATGASWLCFYGALQIGPASVVVPLDKLSILFTVVFAYVFLHENIRKRSWAGLAVLVTGTLLLLV